jgi:hypothetical protein
MGVLDQYISVDGLRMHMPASLLQHELSLVEFGRDAGR